MWTQGKHDHHVKHARVQKVTKVRRYYSRMIPVTSMPMNLVILKTRVTLDGSMSLSCVMTEKSRRVGAHTVSLLQPKVCLVSLVLHGS